MDNSRRVFLKVTALGLGSAAMSAIPRFVLAQGGNDSPFNFVADPENPSELEAEHLLNIRLPLIAEDGSNVPIVVTMENHPMEDDHYIKSLQIYGFTDPIVSKGLFFLSPANGQAHISTQIRMDGGDANLYVVGECTQHGLWAAQATLKVSLGGC